MNIEKLKELGIEVKDGKIKKEDAKQVRRIYELEGIKERIKSLAAKRPSLSSLEHEEQVRTEIKQALQTAKTEGREDAWLLTDLTNWLSLALHYATFGEEMRLSWDSISLERVGPYHYRVSLNAFMGGDRADEYYGDCVFEFYDEDNKLRAKIGNKVLPSPSKFIKEAFNSTRRHHKRVIEKKKKAIKKELKKDPEVEDIKQKIKSLSNVYRSRQETPGPLDNLAWLRWLKDHNYTTEEGEEYLAEDVDSMIKRKEAEELEASLVQKKLGTLANLALGASKTTVKQAEKMIPTIEMAKKQIEYVSTILPEIDAVLKDSKLFFEIPALRRDFTASFDQSNILQGLDEVLQALRDYTGAK